MNFFRLSIASVDGKQNLSEIVCSALVGFTWYEKEFGFRVLPVFPGFRKRKSDTFLTDFVQNETSVLYVM